MLLYDLCVFLLYIIYVLRKIVLKTEDIIVLIALIR